MKIPPIARILSIDDEEDYRRLVRLILEPYGCEVLEGGSVAEAKRLLKKGPLDCAILDINLPDGSGFDILKMIREDDGLSHIPIMMLTIRQVPVDETKALETGADDYMVKPFEPDELVARIRKFLKHRI